MLCIKQQTGGNHLEEEKYNQGRSWVSLMSDLILLKTLLSFKELIVQVYPGQHQVHTLPVSCWVHFILCSPQKKRMVWLDNLTLCISILQSFQLSFAKKSKLPVTIKDWNVTVWKFNKCELIWELGWAGRRAGGNVESTDAVLTYAMTKKTFALH